MNKAIILLTFLFAPFPLLLIEGVLPYPHIVEELFKLVLVYYLYKYEKQSRQDQLKSVILGGIFFALSEDVLHLSNFVGLAGMPELILRVVLTGILHTVTTCILYLGVKKGKTATVVCFVAAALLHYAYNYAVLNVYPIVR